MSGDPDKCGTESSRKKVEAAAAFLDDPRFFATFDRVFTAALSVKNEMQVKGTLYVRIHCADR